MSRPAAQTDLFGHAPAQGELFAPAEVAKPWRHEPDMAKIRGQLQGWLGELRAADGASPWPRAETRLRLVLGPQMAGWFPEDERAAFRADWAREVERLGLVV
jgi:hypothetical protein